MHYPIRVSGILLALLIVAAPLVTPAQSNSAGRAVPTWHKNGRIYFKSGPKENGAVYSR
jgi:hypothetical protein